jgi:hypothetical protein
MRFATSQQENAGYRQVITKYKADKVESSQQMATLFKQVQASREGAEAERKSHKQETAALKAAASELKASHESVTASLKATVSANESNTVELIAAQALKTAELLEAKDSEAALLKSQVLGMSQQLTQVMAMLQAQQNPSAASAASATSLQSPSSASLFSGAAAIQRSATSQGGMEVNEQQGVAIISINQVSSEDDDEVFAETEAFHSPINKGA